MCIKLLLLSIWLYVELATLLLVVLFLLRLLKLESFNDVTNPAWVEYQIRELRMIKAFVVLITLRGTKHC